jgi:hypothetical protein
MTDLDAKKDEIDEALQELDEVSSSRLKKIGEIDEQQQQLDEKIASSLKKLRQVSSE